MTANVRFLNGIHISSKMEYYSILAEKIRKNKGKKALIFSCTFLLKSFHIPLKYHYQMRVDPRQKKLYESIFQ